MGKITIIVTIIILILTECENENTPSNSDVIVQVDGKIKNLENFKGFVQNSERGQKDKVRVISYTIEGTL